MQRTIPIALAIAALLLPSIGEASTPNTGAKPWDSDAFITDGPVPTAVTDHMKCVITEVRGDRIVRVWDEGTESNHLVRISEEIPIQVRRRRDFDGRKTIGFDDLRPGHRVKLTYQTSSGRIVGLKVIDQVPVPAAAATK